MGVPNPFRGNGGALLEAMAGLVLRPRNNSNDGSSNRGSGNRIRFCDGERGLCYAQGVGDGGVGRGGIAGGGYIVPAGGNEPVPEVLEIVSPFGGVWVGGGGSGECFSGDGDYGIGKIICEVGLLFGVGDNGWGLCGS